MCSSDLAGSIWPIMFMMQGAPGQGGMGMMNMMGQMDPAELKRMTENCNKMMESMQSPSSGTTPEKGQAEPDRAAPPFLSGAVSTD